MSVGIENRHEDCRVSCNVIESSLPASGVRSDLSVAEGSASSTASSRATIALIDSRISSPLTSSVESSRNPPPGVKYSQACTVSAFSCSHEICDTSSLGSWSRPRPSPLNRIGSGILGGRDLLDFSATLNQHLPRFVFTHYLTEIKDNISIKLLTLNQSLPHHI